MLENLFKLKENHTSVKTEVIAGITTFMTMAYILAVNPSVLSAAGMDPILSIHAKHFRFYSIKVVRTKESAQFRIIITAGGDIEFGIVIVAVSTITEWV